LSLKRKKDLARRRKSYSKKLDKKLNPKGLQAKFCAETVSAQNFACLYFLSNFRSGGLKKNLITVLSLSNSFFVFSRL
jgi:hypothetical protein